MKTRTFFWGAAFLFLVCAGCTSKKKPKAAASQSKPAAETQVGEAEPEEVSTRAVSPDERKLQLEVLFRTVRSSGFKRKAEVGGVSSQKACREAFSAIVSQGEDSYAFLEGKLKGGDPVERLQAMWLMGALGEDGRHAVDRVSDLVVGGWERPVYRCLRKRLKAGGTELPRGERLTADAVEPVVMGECLAEVAAKEPPMAVDMACKTLARLKSGKGAQRLTKAGIHGRFLRPCVTYLVDAGLAFPQVRKRLRRELNHSANGPQVRTAMVNAGAAGLIAMVDMLAEAKADPKTAAPFHCFSDGIMRLMKARPFLRGPATLISTRKLEELEELGTAGETSDGAGESEVGKQISECARRLREQWVDLKFSPGAQAKEPPGLKALDFGPFCQ